MHKTLLAVRILDQGEVAGYASYELNLPFQPFTGLRFEHGSSCTIWETTTRTELDPEVERVIYDLDEETFVCLFTIDAPLNNTLWREDTVSRPGVVSSLERYFRHTPIPR